MASIVAKTVSGREGGALAPPALPGPSDSQLAAIEAGAGPMLVLAGPGAGKTYCLTERIRHLIDKLDVRAERICAFTFTNKAADEIAGRLTHLGPAAERVKRGTIHAFCAELLREFGTRVGLQAGFGIADEDYQRGVLRRLRVPGRWHGNLLNKFAGHRFRSEPLFSSDERVLRRYEEFLKRRNVLDFDMLVLKAEELMEHVPDAAAAVRSRWDCVLVDEFQDLNRSQYALVRALASDHRHVFAVGDDEQSIYTWAGADPKLFTAFLNDFGLPKPLAIEENRRCPRQIFSLARVLLNANTPLFADRTHARVDRESPFPVEAWTFETHEYELSWMIDDLRHDRESHELHWGDFALLYRKHEIGDLAEAAMLNAGIPCRLAQGRALAEDPVVAYLIAALKVIANPGDTIHKENFLRVVLPKALLDVARTKAEENGETLLRQLNRMSHALAREDEDGRKLRRAMYALRNLAALGRRHAAVVPLVEELLSQRVGEYRTVLEERHDELSDPSSHSEVIALAERLSAARDSGRAVWIAPHGGAEIALKGILLELDFDRVQIGGSPSPDAEEIAPEHAAPSLGFALSVFKAAQLVVSREFTNAFRDFTAVDLETTGRNTGSAEIVQIAAVRVRDGSIVDEFRSLVKPRVAFEEGATKTHGLTAADVEHAPYFEDVWQPFREFCGRDVIVAHNGYAFDFPILKRMAEALPATWDLCTYDTLPLARDLVPASRKLEDLARAYRIDAGQSHQALDDARALAHVFLALNAAKLRRARITALVNLVDHLAVALALSDQASLPSEAQAFLQFGRAFALGRYSECLEFYRLEREHAGDPAHPTIHQLIEKLGGEKFMLRLRTEKTADDRYPLAMLRVRRLLEQCQDGDLGAQIGAFLERVALSARTRDVEVERDRVNLLTLHSTKGLEFSRVYILGVEDAQLLGDWAKKRPRPEELEEARRLLYVGMTRTKERLVLTRAAIRGGKATGGHQFLDEMGLIPRTLS